MFYYEEGDEDTTQRKVLKFRIFLQMKEKWSFDLKKKYL